MSITATTVLQLLLKRAQEAELPDPEVRDDNYSHSMLLPPLAAAPPPVAAPLAQPAFRGVTPAMSATRHYIPPLQPGQQTAAQRAVWQAAIDAQGGQGVVGRPGVAANP